MIRMHGDEEVYRSSETFQTKKDLGQAGSGSLKLEASAALPVMRPRVRGNICSSTLLIAFNMAAPPSAYKDRHFLAVIGDEVGASISCMEALQSSHIY